MVKCGPAHLTVQLDFNLPQAFDLKYRSPEQPAGSASSGAAATPAPAPAAPAESSAAASSQPAGEKGEKEEKAVVPHVLSPGFQRPVMIHRALFGSLERFMAIATENCAGKW
jgi:threonyl-tRNA synthetase